MAEEEYRPAADDAVFTVSRGAARAAPLGSIKVIGATQKLDEVHAYIAVQIVVLCDDFLDVALQTTPSFCNMDTTDSLLFWGCREREKTCSFQKKPYNDCDRT